MFGLALQQPGAASKLPWMKALLHSVTQHCLLCCLHPLQANAEAATATEAAAAPATTTADDRSSNPALLQSSRAELLRGLTGPIVKITAHYHVDFGDCLKVIGSSSEFGSWDATGAPLMTWGEGDVWSLVMPLSAGDHEFKVM